MADLADGITDRLILHKGSSSYARDTVSDGNGNVGAPCGPCSLTLPGREQIRTGVGERWTDGCASSPCTGLTDSHAAVSTECALAVGLAPALGARRRTAWPLVRDACPNRVYALVSRSGERARLQLREVG
jgi:hypothetical protein